MGDINPYFKDVYSEDLDYISLQEKHMQHFPDKGRYQLSVNISLDQKRTCMYVSAVLTRIILYKLFH